MVLGGEVAVEHGAADPKVFGDVLGGVAVSLHPFRGGDVLGIGNLSRPPELGAVGAESLPLQRSTLFYQFTLAKQVSFLNIRDPHEPVHSLRNSPGRRVRYPSVTSESEFS